MRPAPPCHGTQLYCNDFSIICLPYLIVCPMTRLAPLSVLSTLFLKISLKFNNGLSCPLASSWVQTGVSHHGLSVSVHQRSPTGFPRSTTCNQDSSKYFPWKVILGYEWRR
jgi:hypothetical protein